MFAVREGYPSAETGGGFRTTGTFVGTVESHQVLLGIDCCGCPHKFLIRKGFECLSTNEVLDGQAIQTQDYENH